MTVRTGIPTLDRALEGGWEPGVSVVWGVGASRALSLLWGPVTTNPAFYDMAAAWDHPLVIVDATTNAEITKFTRRPSTAYVIVFGERSAERVNAFMSGVKAAVYAEPNGLRIFKGGRSPGLFIPFPLETEAIPLLSKVPPPSVSSTPVQSSTMAINEGRFRMLDSPSIPVQPSVATNESRFRMLDLPDD